MITAFAVPVDALSIHAARIRALSDEPHRAHRIPGLE
jgi:hypothetical protein